MISFGAVGAPDVPDHISLWGLRLAICQPHMYANVRYVTSWEDGVFALTSKTNKGHSWYRISSEELSARAIRLGHHPREL